MIVIQSDFSDVYAELDRVGSMPDLQMIANLDAVLHLGFANALAMVHVDTGRLKASGTKKSKANKHDWKGEFSFPAKNSSGVSYGMYERERGGEHDFLSAVDILEPLFKAAIMKGLNK
jgi:hypothetical protein